MHVLLFYMQNKAVQLYLHLALGATTPVYNTNNTIPISPHKNLPLSPTINIEQPLK